MWMRHLLHNQWLWRCLFYPLVAFVLFLATSPRAYPIPSSSIDKVNHFLAFFVMAILLDRAHQRLGVKGMVIILGALGMIIEIIQYFLPYRDFSLLDWLADMGGVALGLALVQLALWVYQRKPLSR